MVRRVCLDSDIIIEILNSNESIRDLINSIGEADFYTTSINSFEVWFGRKKSELIFELLERLHVLDLDNKSALMAADIQRSLREKDKSIDLRDLFIASVCIRNNVELLSLNKQHFERLNQFGLILT